MYSHNDTYVGKMVFILYVIIHGIMKRIFKIEAIRWNLTGLKLLLHNTFKFLNFESMFDVDINKLFNDSGNWLVKII